MGGFGLARKNGRNFSFARERDIHDENGTDIIAYTYDPGNNQNDISAMMMIGR